MSYKASTSHPCHLNLLEPLAEDGSCGIFLAEDDVRICPSTVCT